MTLEEFGQAVTNGIRARLREPVTLRDDKAAIWIGTKPLRAEVTLETFYRMHVAGTSVEAVAEHIAHIWTETRSPLPLRWDEVKDSLVAHVVHHPPAVPNVVLASLSPVLAVAGAVNAPDYVRILLPHDLEDLGVSVEVLREVSRLNMERILSKHPGEETISPFGSRITVFQGDLASDRAYAHIAAAPKGAAAFLAPEFAIVSRDVAQDSLAGLSVMAGVGAQTLALTHAFPPAVHVFHGGRTTALMLASEAPTSR